MINAKEKRNFDLTWDYVTANTKEFTHCYHPYPAMMIPQIARRLIKEYSNKDTSLLFDPYCGTGTSLLEANLSGINAIGTDLNPLARLIAQAKVTRFDLLTILKSTEMMNDEFVRFDESNGISTNLFSFQNNESNYTKYNDVKIPHFPNIDFWFSEQAKCKLAFIQFLINEEIDESVKKFFLVPFSETIRESSYTRNGEFKLFRIPYAKIKEFNPDPFQIYLSKVYRNIQGLKEFLESKSYPVYSKIYDFNTCNNIPENLFHVQEIDLIVTSPPYGDSRTTVAYGQFSRLSNQWLGFDNASQIDNMLMGGNGTYKSGYIEFDSAKRELYKLKELDTKRFNDVQSFLIDYSNSIRNISPLVREGAYVCYVLGNRTVKSIEIPLDLITVEIFQEQGFEHIQTSIRNIPNKRMPKMNSPSNIPGELSNTMNNEYIVVMRKI